MNDMKKTFIRVVTSLIPSKKARKKIRAKWLATLQKSMVQKKLPTIRERQRELERVCRDKIIHGEKVRVCFIVCDVSMFSAESVFLKMRSDSTYDCFIAIVPRVTRGEAFLRETLMKTYDSLHGKYGDCVKIFYNTDNKQTKSLNGLADLIFTSIIYEEQSCGMFTVEAMSKYALVALISYGYSGLFKTNIQHTIFLPNIVFAWKLFISNQDTLDLWTKGNNQLRSNAILSGYAKMDRLAEFSSAKNDSRKKILIAPHHSLARGTDGLSLSNFLKLSNFFLSLPERYPQVNFVFRPHPLLFPRLATDAWWGKDRTLRYKEKMSSFANVEFQQGGDYFETFAQSDALIHDCGSFLAEYFYTSKPQCYILENDAERQFLPFGRKLLEQVYISHEEQDILDFIDNVVLAGNDPMEENRRHFAETSVCCYYPHATDRILQTISTALKPLQGELS